MKEATKTLALIDIIFIVFLMFRGTVSGFFGELIYYFAFLIPIFIGFYKSVELKRSREEERGVAEAPDKFLSLDFCGLKSFMPLVFPSVLIIFGVSALTAYLLSQAGIESDTVMDTGIVNMILVHALVPALFEEALFRYIPMKLLLPYSNRLCVLYSAFCFALIHCSFSKIPYAFVAGIIFMMIDVAIGSIWPSVILHFVNNATSCIWMKYCTTEHTATICLCILIILSAVSSVFVYLRRKEYKRLFLASIDKGQSTSVGYPIIMLFVICIYIAVESILF